MKRALRLRHDDDIRRVLRRGKSWSNRWFVLYALPGAGAHSRCAVIVGKRVGKAVVRNRLKRRLREIVRHRIDRIEGSWDIVFIARKGAADADFSQSAAAVDQLLERSALGVIPATKQNGG